MGNIGVIESDYWIHALSLLRTRIARVRLHNQHQLTLKIKLQTIKQERETFYASASTSTIPKTKEDNQNIQLGPFNDDNKIELMEDLKTKCLRQYEQGRYSPTLININKVDMEIQKQSVDETDDWEKLEQQRESVIKSSSVKPDSKLQE